MRRKSFEDLHTLWYILSKERVRLLSEKKRDGSAVKAKGRFLKIKRAMGKIKRVLHERDLVYRDAESRLATLKPIIESQLQIELDKLENEKLNLLQILSQQKQNDLAQQSQDSQNTPIHSN